MFHYKSFITKAILLIAIIAITLPATSQVNFRDVRSLSVGGGGAAFVEDQDAIFFNPANLALGQQRSRFTLSFAGTGVYTGGQLIRIGLYNDYLAAGRDLTVNDTQEMITKWFGEGGTKLRRLGTYVDVVPLSFTIQGKDWGMGFAARVRSFNSFGTTSGLLDLALIGLDVNREVPLDLEIKSSTTTELSFAYSRYLPQWKLAVGIAPKLILGITYVDLSLQSSLIISDGTLQHEYDYVVNSAGPSTAAINATDLFASTQFDSDNFDIGTPTIAGSGFGFDLGATWDFTEQVRFSASITDLGFVNWSQQTVSVKPVHSQFVFSGLDLDLNVLNNEYDGNFGEYIGAVMDSLLTEAYDGVEKDSAGTFRSSLPTGIHLGSTFHTPNRKGIFSAGMSFGLNSAAGNMSKIPTLYAGAEYRLGAKGFYIPIRTGFRLGGESAMNVSFGTGINTAVWDIHFGASVTPGNSLLGVGGRYAMAVGALTLRFP